MTRAFLALGRSALCAAALATLTVLPAHAAGEASFEKRDWSFSGPFGTFDRASLQRGYQVYRETCAACHSLKFISFRNLADLGYSEDEIKELAAGYETTDGPDDSGAMYQRPSRPSDRLPAPFPNEPAARMANNGALPPDLSLITKARKGGADYIYAVLTGYADAPEDFALGEGMYYNTAFPGHQIAMPTPIIDDGVSFADGTPATADQIASDVVTFLTWAAEPELAARKSLGLKVLIFLVVFTAMLAAVKRKVWADLH